MKHLVKRNGKIIGFVTKDLCGQYWYAFGRPSQNNYISFACNSLEQGIARIETHTH